MEKKPNKKEELTLVNNVLKLATKLLKVKKKKRYNVEYAVLILYLSFICRSYLVFGFYDYPHYFQIIFEHIHTIYILLHIVKLNRIIQIIFIMKF